MRAKLLFLALGVATLMSACVREPELSGVTPSQAHYDRPLSTGQAVSLDIDGHIGADVSVVGSNAANVKLDAVQIRGGSGLVLTTSTDSRGVHLRLDPSSYQHRSFPSIFGRHEEANITLSVPRSAELELQAVNGPMRIDRVTGPLRVNVVNGLIDVVGGGSVQRLHLVNGAIDAGITDLSRSPDVDIACINGSIDLTVPSGFKARVDAHTLLGPLEQHVNDDQAAGNVKIRLVAGPITIEER